MNPRPKTMIEKLRRPVYFGVAGAMVVSWATGMITNEAKWTSIVFAGSFWLLCAFFNIAAYEKGEFEHEDGKVVRRDVDPAAFYRFMIPITVFTMGVVTALLIIFIYSPSIEWKWGGSFP